MSPKLTRWQKQYLVSSDSSSSPSPPPTPDMSSSSVPASLATLSSSAVVEGDAREPPLRRFLLTPGLAVRAALRSGCCGFAFLTVSAFFCGLGPTLPAREPGVEGLGVPGPTEPCRPKFEDAEGRGPMLPVGRRRLLSLPADISRSCRVFACMALCAFVSLCWFNSACVCMFCNDGLSLAFRFTLVALLRRAIAAACARLGAPPPWFPDTGCSGVLVPVFDSDVGGTMLPGDSLSRDGICGSDGIDPSFCRSRNLMSSRFTCRSSCGVCEQDSCDYEVLTYECCSLF